MTTPAELSTQPVAVDTDGLILRVGDHVVHWFDRFAGTIAEILGDGWVTVAVDVTHGLPGLERTTLTNHLILIGHPRRCVAKVGEPFHMAECGRSCVYLDLLRYHVFGMGDDSGWYHLPLGERGNHHAVPESFVR
jgi:hypothetical protein